MDHFCSSLQGCASAKRLPMLVCQAGLSLANSLIQNRHPNFKKSNIVTIIQLLLRNGDNLLLIWHEHALVEEARAVEWCFGRRV